MTTWPTRLEAGSPYPLGATWDGLGVNFAVFSAHAQRMDLCIFDKAGRREVARFCLPEYTDEVWHGYLPEGRPGLLYGFRAFGPYDPVRGHRFNPHKLLLDPYAKGLHGSLVWSDALFGYRIGGPRGDLSFDRRDSGQAMPKCVVSGGGFEWGKDRLPAVPWGHTVIMEAHVRGMSILRDDIPPAERGTFRALSHPATIEYLTKLGVTTLELMPVQAFARDRFLLERGLTNYWGYSTLGFFAPHPAYLSDGSMHEMQAAIRRLHAAGIEVIMDVVYNHTCEGNELGPTLSWRGLDNATYYRLVPADERHFINDTGCGNTLNLSHPRVLQMVMDSLRYWAVNFHIDGFRFDLGTTLGREAYGFDPCSGFFDALRQDPVLCRLKLIMEPWDPGPGGYQLGNFPPGLAEWNNRFRDTTRRFWRGDELQRGDMAVRLSGSGDLFDRRGRRPCASINFVTAHDGFTLMDQVSYVERHNAANGEDGRDGHADNLSANWGVEGLSDDPGISRTRTLVRRGMLATLLLAQGTPMLLAGDEFGQTQQGNNNAYCQDNATSWLDWSRADEPQGREMQAYVAKLTALRQEHPSVRGDTFWHDRHCPSPDITDISWHAADGTAMTPEKWNDPNDRVLGLRRACRRPAGAPDVTFLLLNPGFQDATCTLPDPDDGEWRLLLDSAEPSGPQTGERMARTVRVAAHSILFLSFTPQGVAKEMPS
ncbi:glycogen debranching protein GlgX [Novacetimonas cocois]|uniref:glycogen debranching protein GlgX n=1 Tax=Novacetimonas cocois TaxID=1747507 RepID=UPI00197EA04C|nr:glycogen debranching protein GlgX [Novacetimonas cocois]